MQSVHRGSSLARSIRPAAKSPYVCANCTSRQFHQQSRLQEGEDAYSDKPAARPVTRRQGSQIAGRMIQGLRGMAPGGFGKPPPDFVPRQPRAKDAAQASKGPIVTRVMRQDNSSASRRRDGNESREPIARRDDNMPRRRRDDREDRALANKDREPEAVKPNQLVATLAEASDASADLENAQARADGPLIERFRQNEFIRWEDADQKKRLETSLQKRARKEAKWHVRRGHESYKGMSIEEVTEILAKNNRNALTTLPQEETNKAVDRDVSGMYESLRKRSGKGSMQESTMAHLKTSMVLNGSYDSKARASMLEFMGAMWPGQRQAHSKRV